MKKNIKIVIVFISLMILCIAAYISLPKITYALEGKINDAIQDTVSAIQVQTNLNSKKFEIREHRGYGILSGGAGSGEVVSYEGAPSYTGGHTSSAGYQGIKDIQSYLDTYLNDAYNWDLGWLASLKYNTSIYCREYGRTFPGVPRHYLGMFHQIGNYNQLGGSYDANNDHLGAKVIDYVEKLAERACQHKITVAPQDWDKEGIEMKTEPISERDVIFAREGGSYIQITAVRLKYTKVKDLTFDTAESYIYSFNKRKYYREDPAQQASWIYHADDNPTTYSGADAEGLQLYRAALAVQDLSDPTKPEMSKSTITEGTLTYSTGTVIDGDYYKVGPIYMNDYQYGWSENVRDVSGKYSLEAPENTELVSHMTEDQKATFKGLIAGIVEAKVELDNGETFYLNDTNFGYYEQDTARRDFVDSDCYYESPAKHGYDYPTPNSKFYIKLPIEDCEGATKVTKITMKYRWLTGDGKGGFLQGYFDNLFWEGKKNFNYEGCTYECTNTQSDGDQCQNDGLIWSDRSAFPGWDYDVHLKKHTFKCGGTGYCKNGSSASVIYVNNTGIPNGIPHECRTLTGDDKYNCGNKHTSHDKGVCSYTKCGKSSGLQCTITPHEHSASCYHTHDSNCWHGATCILGYKNGNGLGDKVLKCTSETHSHTNSCYHYHKASCCSKEIHEHSIEGCGLVHPCEKNYCDHGFLNGNHTCGVKDEHSHSDCGRSWGKNHIGDCYGKEGEDSEAHIGTFCPDHGAGIHKSCYEFDWIVIKEDFDVRSQNLMYVEEAHVYENQIESTIEEIPLITRVEIDKFIYDVEHTAKYIGEKDNTYKAGDDRRKLDETTKEGNPVYVETDDKVTYKIVLSNYSAFGVKVKVDDILPESTAYEFDKAQCGTWETNDLDTLRDYLIPIAAGSESSPGEASIMVRLKVKALEGKYENKARIITRNDSPKVPDKEEDIDYIRTTDDDGPIVNHIQTTCNGTKETPEWESSDWFMLNNYNAFIDKYVYSYDELVQKENNDVLGISKEDSVIGEDGQLLQKVDGKDVSRRNLTKTTKEVSDGNVMDIIRTDDKAKETYKGQHPVNVEQGEKITYAIRVSNEAKEIPKTEPTGTKPATQLRNLRIEDIMHEGLEPTGKVSGKIFEYVDGVNDTEVKDLGAVSLSGSGGKYYITALAGEKEVLEPNQYVEFYIEVDVVQSNMYLPSMENSAELVAAQNVNNVTIFDRDGGVDRMISEQTASKEFVRMKDLLIAGYVWLDIDQDGLMNDKARSELDKVNNNINDDAMKEDVVVRLYRVDGDVDTTTGMAKGTEIRRTKTDENGLYTFARAESSSSWYDTFNHTVDYEPDGTAVNDVRYQRIDKADGKDGFGNYTENSKYYSYFVEFEYDGVLYRSTEIYADNKNLNGDGSFKSEEYTIDSNAMELKADREEFNNRYEYISYDVAYDMNLDKDPNGSDLVFQKDGHSSYLMEDSSRDMTAKSFITAETEKIKPLWLYHMGNDNTLPKTDYLKYINLGLELREDVDLALTKDVYNLKTTVNGEEMEYDFNLGDTDGFLNDYIVKKPYGFEIYESDYKYRVEQYITKAVEAYKGINGEDELNIEITYRINLQNIPTRDDEEMATLEPDNPEVNKDTKLYARVHEILDLYDENFMKLTGNDEDDTVDLKVKNEEGFLEDKQIKVAEAWMFMTKAEAGERELLEDGKTYKKQRKIDDDNENNDIYVADPTGDYVKVKLEMSHVSSRGEKGVFSAKGNDFSNDGYHTAYIRGMEDQVIGEGDSINIYVKYVVDKDKLEITVDENYENTTEITKEAYTWNDAKQNYDVIEIKDDNFKAKAIISEIFKETITQGETTTEVSKATIERALKLKDHREETNEFKALYGRGTENIAQIDAYSIWYDVDGTIPASLVDKDSNAGNVGIKNTSTNASPNGSGYSEEAVSADNVEYYEDTTYKTGIELAAEGTEQTRDEIEKTYDTRIPEVDRIIEITAEYDLIRKITGKVWDDSRSNTLGSGNEIQYVANGMYNTSDKKLDEAKDNKNVELNYKEPDVTEQTDIAVRNAKAEFIEIVKIPRIDAEGNHILDADGNKQFDYYEEVLTNVTWDQVQNVRTGENGEYTLEGFKPGRYVVRFTYGDVNEEAKTTDGSAVWDKIKEFDDRIEALSERTDLTTEKAIYEEKEKILNERNQLLESEPELKAVKDMLIFNGQDYKSTKYTGVQDDPTLKEDEVIQGFQTPNNSDARDDEIRRLEVNAYSEVMTNEMAEILKGLVNGDATLTPNSTANTSTELKALTENTYMEADTVEFLIKPEKLIETETYKQKIKYESEYKYDPDLPYYKYLTALMTEHIKERDFTIENVDFGIEYRPESQISLMKEIKEITLKTTAKNGESDILVNLHFATEGDGVNRTHKIIEEDSIGYELVQFITNNYTDKTLINNVMSEESLQGLVYIQVDEEVLQGCTIEITYGFDAQNNSEIDRISKQLNAIRYRDNKATDDLIASYNTKYAGQDHKAFSLFDLTHIQNTKYTASALSKAAVFADTFALDDEGIVYREIPKTTTTNGTDGYYGRFVGHGYYIGEESDLDTISSLKFDKILDYIDTNLEYEQKTNSEEMTNKLWSKINSGELVGLVSYYKGVRNSVRGLPFEEIQTVKNEFTKRLEEDNAAFTKTVNDITLERKITDGKAELLINDVKFEEVTNIDGIEYKSMVVSIDDRNVDPGDPNDTGDVKNKDLSKFLLPKVALVGWEGEDDVDSPEYEEYTGQIFLDVSKVLAAGSDADDKTYENMAEIVQFTTLNGRRTNFATTIGNADIKAIKEKLDNDLPPFNEVEPDDPKNPGSIEFITASLEPDTSATETITLIPPTGLMRSRRPIAYIMEATKTGVEIMSMVGLVVAIVLAIGAVVVYTTRRVQRKRIK